MRGGEDVKTLALFLESEHPAQRAETDGKATASATKGWQQDCWTTVKVPSGNSIVGREEWSADTGDICGGR